MPREKDEERDHRIHDEIIVDAYGDEEQAMSWYYPRSAYVFQLPSKSGARE
jgi:Calcium binding